VKQKVTLLNFYLKKLKISPFRIDKKNLSLAIFVEFECKEEESLRIFLLSQVLLKSFVLDLILNSLEIGVEKGSVLLFEEEKASAISQNLKKNQSILIHDEIINFLKIGWRFGQQKFS